MVNYMDKGVRSGLGLVFVIMAGIGFVGDSFLGVNTTNIILKTDLFIIILLMIFQDKEGEEK